MCIVFKDIPLQKKKLISLDMAYLQQVKFKLFVLQLY